MASRPPVRRVRILMDGQSMRLHRGLYVITDCSMPFDDMVAATERILAAGIAALQFRSKKSPAGEKADQAQVLFRMCRRAGTPFIVNDDVDLAARLNADGVHVGRDDAACRDARARIGPGAVVGVSCYDDLQRAVRARDDGADYVAFGAFFPTRSKGGTAHATVELLRRARATLQLPVAAIGDITPQNAAPLLEAGADLLAVISSVYHAPDPGAVVKHFNSLPGLQACRE